MKKLTLITIFLLAPLMAYGQQECQPGFVCIRQSTVDAAARAAGELIEARDVIRQFTVERAATQAERDAAARLVDRLNAVIAVQDRLTKDYEAVIALYKQVIQMQGEIIERMAKQINAPKTAWQKFANVLKTIATVAAGILIGRAGI